MYLFGLGKRRGLHSAFEPHLKDRGVSRVAAEVAGDTEIHTVGEGWLFHDGLSDAEVQIKHAAG